MGATQTSSHDHASWASIAAHGSLAAPTALYFGRQILREACRVSTLGRQVSVGLKSGGKRLCLCKFLIAYTLARSSYANGQTDQ